MRASICTMEIPASKPCSVDIGQIDPVAGVDIVELYGGDILLVGVEAAGNNHARPSVHVHLQAKYCLSQKLLLKNPV